MNLRFVFLGPSITSTRASATATTYRGLVRELVALGHDVLFLERDRPGLADIRDLATLPWGRVALYETLEELRDRYAADVREADAVVVGSHLPDGVAVGDWVIETTRGLPVFYDLDTPVTLAGLARGVRESLAADQIPRYGLYLSFTGGPTLDRLERVLGSPCARALHGSADPEVHRPRTVTRRWELGFLGTFREDRQAALEELLFGPARDRTAGRFAVAGPKYPATVRWPENVDRLEHVPAGERAAFFGAQAFTLNVTRADLRQAGWSPTVRLFEAAACGTPVVSDRCEGLETFFRPGIEILLVDGRAAVLEALAMPEEARRRIGESARARVLAQHTPAHRAREFERWFAEARARRARPGGPRRSSPRLLEGPAAGRMRATLQARAEEAARTARGSRGKRGVA